MKIKLLLIFCVLLSFCLVFTACDNGTTGNSQKSDGTESSLSGTTWGAKSIPNTRLEFSGGNFTLWSYTSVGLSGIVSSNSLTPTGGFYMGGIDGPGTGTINGNTLTISFTSSYSPFANDTYTKL
jgi:hypothetical protein